MNRILLAGLSVWCSVVAAQAIQSTSASDPIATVNAFREAMDGINPTNVPRLLVADDANGRAMITEINGLAIALAHLRAAMQAEFGPQAGTLLNHSAQRLSERIDGEHATVTNANGKETHLRRENGRWRIVVISTGIDASEQIAELHVMAEAIESIATDTRAKRFDNPEEAARATEEELLRGRQIRHSATAPATTYVK